MWILTDDQILYMKVSAAAQVVLNADSISAYMHMYACYIAYE